MSGESFHFSDCFKNTAVSNKLGVKTGKFCNKTQHSLTVVGAKRLYFLLMLTPKTGNISVFNHILTIPFASMLRQKVSFTKQIPFWYLLEGDESKLQ